VTAISGLPPFSSRKNLLPGRMTPPPPTDLLVGDRFLVIKQKVSTFWLGRVGTEVFAPIPFALPGPIRIMRFTGCPPFLPFPEFVPGGRFAPFLSIFPLRCNFFLLLSRDPRAWLQRCVAKSWCPRRAYRYLRCFRRVRFPPTSIPLRQSKTTPSRRGISRSLRPLLAQGFEAEYSPNVDVQ